MFSTGYIACVYTCTCSINGKPLMGTRSSEIGTVYNRPLYKGYIYNLLEEDNLSTKDKTCESKLSPMYISLVQRFYCSNFALVPCTEDISVSYR